MMVDRIVLGLLVTGMLVMFLWSLWAGAQLIGCMTIPIDNQIIVCGEGWNVIAPAA